MNPHGIEFVQVCQGRNHILMLDSSGKVYGYGDNNYFQIYNEGNNITQQNTSHGHMSHRSNADLATPSQRSHKVSSVAKGDLMHDRGTEFIDKVQEISFSQFSSVSIYKIHAFNNTSLAVDRSGELYLWGENCLSESHNPKPIKQPSPIKEYKKVKISKERNQLLPDRISRVDDFQSNQADQVLQMIDQYKANNSISLSKFKQDIELARSKIAQIDITITQKEQLVKNFQENIENYESQLSKLKNSSSSGAKDEQIQLKEMIRNAKNKKDDVQQEIIKLVNEKSGEDDRIKEYSGKQMHVVFDKLDRRVQR